MISAGCDSSQHPCNDPGKTRVYINNGTTFTENLIWQQNLTEEGEASIALGDIDNDGDLDLILTGVFASKARLYINNGTTFTENLIWQQQIIIDDTGSGSVAFGDIDNDGDLDLLFPDAGTPGELFYINNGTSFVNDSIWSLEITDAGKISTGLADFDNDGDLDLNILGESSAKSYKNNRTNFFSYGNWNTISRDEGNVAWGDIDNDGDFDQVISGGSRVIFLINNISYGDEFVDVLPWDFYLSPISWGSIMFGDYDNNGYLDLVNTGISGGNQIQIAENNGTTFARDAIAEANLTGIRESSALWGDIDNDGDLDLVVIKSQKVYTNNITMSNKAPTPPTSFSSSYNNREIKLGWLNGSDAETPSLGLYYNLMIGNSTVNHTIISGIYGGSGDASRGGTTFGYYGNMMQRKNFTLKVDRLQASTTYKWYVQTIDTALKAGNWSSVQTFTTPADMERPNVTLSAPVNYFNSSSYIITFNATVTDLNLTNVSLWGNWTGSFVLNQTNSSQFNGTYIFTKNLTSYGNGNYIWMIEARDNATNIQNSSIRTFTIDTTAPNITNETKSPSTIYTNSNATLNATITDVLVGVQSVWISINITGNFTNYTVSSSNSNYSFTLSSGNYSKNNNVSWRYYANDSLGNTRTGNLQSFVVANSPPNLTGIPDNSTNEDTTPPNRFYNLSLYASDADSDSLTFNIQNQSNSSLINCAISNSIYINCTTPAANLSGSSTIIVNVTDGTDWANDTFIVNVTAVNDIPWLTNVNLTSSAKANLTNESLIGAYTFNDVESSSQTANETKWYRNNTEITNLANFSSISSGNTTKGENWTFSARVYDGTNWSNWYNSSILTILNSAPDFSTIGNLSWPINSNYTLNLSLYFSDIDLDSLTYTNTTPANITITYNTSIVTFAPVSGWNGTSYVIFTANDTTLARNSNNITLTVFKPVFNFTEFDGLTTNFSNLTNFVNIIAIIEKANFGKISFSSVILNRTIIDMNQHVNISGNRIEINSSALPELNSSATLSLYNLTLTNPRVLKDGAVCSACVKQSYSSGTFMFNVTSFSVYSADETPATPSDSGSSGGGGRRIISKNASTEDNGTIAGNVTEVYPSINKTEAPKEEKEEKKEGRSAFSYVFVSLIIFVIVVIILFYVVRKRRSSRKEVKLIKKLKKQRV